MVFPSNIGSKATANRYCCSSTVGLVTVTFGTTRCFNRDYKAATARLVREVLFFPSSDPTLVERVVRSATSAPEEIAISALRNAWAYDAREAARKLRAPVRAINTDRFPTNLEANQHLCRDYAVVIMEGLDHYPMLEDPEGFNQALEGVLRKLELRTNGG